MALSFPPITMLTIEIPMHFQNFFYFPGLLAMKGTIDAFIKPTSQKHGVLILFKNTPCSKETTKHIMGMYAVQLSYSIHTREREH